MHYNKSHSLSVQIPKGHSLYPSPAFFFTPYLSSPITVILLPKRRLICFIFISYSLSLILFSLSIIIFSAFLLKMWGRWQMVNYLYVLYLKTGNIWRYTICCEGHKHGITSPLEYPLLLQGENLIWQPWLIATNLHANCGH